MTAFDKWNERYKRYWCTLKQLQTLTMLGVLSKSEYKEITGEDYAV